MKAKVGLLLLFVKSGSQMFLPGEKKSWSAEIADNRANHSNRQRTEQFASQGWDKRLKLESGLHTASLTLNYRLFPS